MNSGYSVDDETPLAISMTSGWTGGCAARVPVQAGWMSASLESLGAGFIPHSAYCNVCLACWNPLTSDRSAPVRWNKFNDSVHFCYYIYFAWLSALCYLRINFRRDCPANARSKLALCASSVGSFAFRGAALAALAAAQDVCADCHGGAMRQEAMLTVRQVDSALGRAGATLPLRPLICAARTCLRPPILPFPPAECAARAGDRQLRSGA